jgi:trk system potassium uptake protein
VLFRPDSQDFRLIGFYCGKVVLGIGVVMLIPAVVGFMQGEVNEALGFLIGASFAVIAGSLSQTFLPTRAPLRASHGLATVALAWLTAPLFAAIPLLLSGHYYSYLDAYFEGMSGLATIGLTLVNDVDHMARSVNLWRHLMQFIGGQGIVVVVLTIFASGGGQIGLLYSGEAREEKIIPNVISTARFIWKVALVYGLIGVGLLWVALQLAGLPVTTAAFHAFNLFTTAFDTAGFATQSTSAAFYRSSLVEAILMILMVAGAFSFAVHYQLWQGRRSELTRNIETRTLAFTILGLFAIMVIGLARTGTITDGEGLLRVGLFHTISAHTTTGLATVPGRLYVTDWGALAPAMLVTAMALGGMAGSTAGGIKAIRIGLVLKGLQADVRRVLLPESAALVETFHSTTKRILRTDQVRAAATILLLYLLLYLLGGMLGLFYGYELQLALFEATAAGSSGGLSVGLVRPELEWQLKAAYIAAMVIGRLEFIAVLALVGYVFSIVRGRV